MTTTWDNGHKEVDGFGFYTFVTVNYRDVDDSKEALAPMQYKTITMTEYDPNAVYNVSAYDKKNIIIVMLYNLFVTTMFGRDE